MKFPDIDLSGVHEAFEHRQEAERAMIELAKNSKPNWAQRHWIWWTALTAFLGGIIGVLGTLLIEYLKLHHLLGL